jgi:hypothetical protein
LLRVTGQRGREASDRWWLALLGLPILCCAGTTLIAALGAGSLIAAVGGLAGSALLAGRGGRDPARRRRLDRATTSPTVTPEQVAALRCG